MIDVMSNPRSRDAIFGGVLLAIAIIIPFLDPGIYFVKQLTLLFIWTAAVTQWNLVFGVAGIWTLAHMVIFATGGYGTAMIGLYLDWSLWVGLPIAALCAIFVSYLIGVATVRLRGPYVAVLTLAIAVAIYALILSDSECFTYDELVCYQFSGGINGLHRFGDFGFKELLGFKLRFFGDYYLALAVLAFGTAFVIAVVRSPFGLAFRGLRDNEKYSRSRGISFTKYQILVFVMSGFFTGLAGGVYAGFFKTMGSSVVGMPLLLYLFTMMIVGGRGYIWGPILGCGLLMLVDDLLRTQAEWRTVVFAVIIIVVVLFMRFGLAGLIEQLWQRYVVQSFRLRREERERSMVAK